ncbi:MAG TPA: hypothetical protein PKE21_17465 [Flavobacteriales bacterium]|nr:hypothetical protein [Flavobacteriales bacterium]
MALLPRTLFARVATVVTRSWSMLAAGLTLLGISPALRAQNYAVPSSPELALSQGHYPEVFGNDTLRRIGNWAYNTVTGRAYQIGGQGQVEANDVRGSEGIGPNRALGGEDMKVGRFLSLDPLAAKYPHNSPYAFSENRVIDAVELEGLEATGFEMRSERLYSGYLQGTVTDKEIHNFHQAGFNGLVMAAGISSGAMELRMLWGLIKAGSWKGLLRWGAEEAVSETFTNLTGIPFVDPRNALRSIQMAATGGRFKGNWAGMEAHERQRSAEYLEGGSALERTDVPGTGGADFRIDGKLTEFKSLQGDKMNHTTGLGRLQEATKKPGVQVIDLDIRTPQGTARDAATMYDRFAGTDQGKAFFAGGGEVRFATTEGMVTYGQKQ